MYIIKKNNRRIPNETFETYEKARQWVRKKVRSSKDRFDGLFFELHSDLKWRTPTLFSHGYSISRVEG